ncbi:hypothetical protein [Mycolicibacterium mengxianglii]|uniref:hypothetical protein n=1 Tax=Mycolicibacterium mengxianglii TaxID=2736649 RepID=UPI0018EED0FF|nr:hypothetical protein [Mycolicibacterium mengxianglii]
MGRHSVARKRRTPSVALASFALPAAVLFAVKGDVGQPPVVAAVEAAPAGELAAAEDLCCTELVAVGPVGLPSPGPAGVQFVADRQTSASRLRTVERTLPAGPAPERGLQVRTILTARSISAVFPEIRDIGGVRADSLRWHPNGLALDVMIQNPGSAEGIALGNQIVAYVMQNAGRFGIQDAIWRGVYYTPSGAHGSGYGHFDHVHVTTTGGGYPAGNETYYR